MMGKEHGSFYLSIRAWGLGLNSLYWEPAKRPFLAPGMLIEAMTYLWALKTLTPGSL